MFDGKIDAFEIKEYLDKLKADGKNEEYLQMLADLRNVLEQEKEWWVSGQNTKIAEVKNGNDTCKNEELVVIYNYTRNADNTVSKWKFIATENEKDYIIKGDCWIPKVSKEKMNQFTDMYRHEMWTDKENDKLMENVLKMYEY